MIAKILSSSKTFNAVEYNEKKDERGQSELLVAKNFNGLENDPSKAAIKEYFKAMAMTNKNVKNPQFHATISTKGKEQSFDELVKVGEEWLQKMGYGKQPYIIYGHSDTKNNHVHIVSVRIDREGKKISDSFERVRSQKALNEILGLDYSQQAERDFKKLAAYNFTTMAQFRLLFERAGWTVTEKNGQINLIKGGETQKTVSVNKVNEMILQNKAIDRKAASKKQLIALLHKYKGGGDYKHVAEIMKSKFGVEMVFHTKEGYDKPYGYTVIDHKNKTVYKGSELMNLKELLEPSEKENQTKTAKEIIRDFISQDNIQNNPNYTLYELKAILDKYGFTLDAEGNVKAGEEQLFKMGYDFNRLKYNTMLKEARKFHVTNMQEARFISSLFQVKVEHLTIDPNRDKDIEDFYKDLAKAYASTGKIDDDVSDQIKVFKNNDMYFVVDFDTQEIYGVNDSSLNQRLNASSVGYTTSVVSSQQDNSVVMEVGKVVMAAVFGAMMSGGGGGGNDAKRKRKKKQESM